MNTLNLTDKNGSFTNRTFSVVGLATTPNEKITFLQEGTNTTYDKLHEPQPQADNDYATVGGTLFQVTVS